MRARFVSPRSLVSWSAAVAAGAAIGVGFGLHGHAQPSTLFAPRALTAADYARAEPNQAHGYGGEGNYMMRRRWDYFTRWLLGAEPPKEYEIGAGQPAGRGGRGGGSQP